MEVDATDTPCATGRCTGGTADLAAANEAAADSRGAASATAPRGRGRRRRSLSQDPKQPSKDENWWLSEGEEDSGEEQSGGGDDEDAAARRPLPPEQADPFYDPAADDEVRGPSMWLGTRKGGAGNCSDDSAGCCTAVLHQHACPPVESCGPQRTYKVVLPSAIGCASSAAIRATGAASCTPHEVSCRP
jgi:hypothetical protein